MMKKNSEAKLHGITEQLSIDNLNYLLNNFHYGISLFSNGNIIYSNKYFQELVGYSSEELFSLSDSIFETIVVKEDLESFQSQIDSALKSSNSSEQFVIRINSKNQIRWIEGYLSKIILSDSDAVIIECRDITSQKRNEEKLIKLTEAIEQSSACIVITDTEGNIEYVNPQFYKLTGYKQEDVLGQNPRILKSGNQPKEYYKEMWDTITRGNIWRGRFQNINAKGDKYWENAIISPIKNSVGEITHYVAVKDDITDFVKAQEKIKDYQKNLEKKVKERTNKLNEFNNLLVTLIDTIPYPIFTKDKDLKFSLVNKALLEFYQLTNEEIIGKSVEYLSPPDVIELTNNIDRKLLDGDDSIVYETYYITKDGTKRNLQIYKSTFGLNKDKPEGIAGIVFDVTEQKTFEVETKEALRHQKELNEMKTNFISMVSHEFRTPLTSILAASDLLELYGRTWPEEKYKKNVSILQESVSDLVDLLNKVLMLSRTDTGKIKYNPVTSDISKFLNYVVEKVKKSSKNSHQINLKIKDNIPSLVLDEKLLDSILVELLNNAIKFSEKDSSILFEVDINNDNLIFSVADSGFGIQEKEIEYIFDPFFRSEKVSGITGNGLGLAIVKKLTELHSGKVEVKSEFEKGSTFTIILPYTG